MCAIAGVLKLPLGETTKEKMLQTMARRGPDGNGCYENGDCTLLHTRLAIIDPAGGRQPMALAHGQERYILSYNGELYNTQELRDALIARGHRFQGHSDTEVVLHSYAEWKEGCVSHLNGIFAFAVWEEKRKRLFLARDRIGVKPLFYMEHAGGLLFASEMKTILAYPTVKAELDEQGAATLIMLGPGRLAGSGIFRGICEIEPACYAFYENGHFSHTRYWKLTDREHCESFEETVECVRYLVEDAIKRQMVSDVPIGTFLSGGLDSSLISAICAREQRAQGKQLKTFSVDYVDNEKYFRANKFQPNSDGHYIRVMQNAIDSSHFLTELTPEILAENLEAATIARDLPGMADVDFSMLAFCGEIRKEVKVALSGECADEIFGGYPWYRDPEVRAREGFPWAQNTTERASLLRPALAERIRPQEFVMDAYLDTIRASDILPENTPEEARMKQMVNLNFRYFMQTLLDRKDRMSMYHSLEVRVPFCDYRIAEYLYAVPWEYKDRNGKEKGLLRCAMDGVLPQEVLWRKKSPYPKTFDPKYEALIRARLHALLQEHDAPIFALIDPQALQTCITGESEWPWYGQLMRRPQTMAYFLQLDFWLRHYGVDILC